MFVTLKLLCLLGVDFIVPFAIAQENGGVHYLQQYGYVEEDNTTLIDEESLQLSIELFQDRYNLTVDGTLNPETLELMSKPRCGNTDTLLPYSASSSRKWIKNHLTWYWYGNVRYMRVVHAAFSVWANHTNLQFTRSVHNPDILINIGGVTHDRLSTQSSCPYPFDGSGNVLAHAFYPEPSVNRVDIHIDVAENWEFNMVIPGPNRTSFYTVLIHEIGHALGLGHSSQRYSAMYPVYDFPSYINDMSQIDLSWDDINGIQYLYGYPPPRGTTSTTSTTTTTTTQPPPPPTVPEPEPKTPVNGNEPSNEPTHLCDYKSKISTLVVVNKRIFMFYEKYVWVLDLNENDRQTSQFTKPKIISQWLSFLPHGFVNISAVYERPNGEIVLFVNRNVYFMEYPSLRLISWETIDKLAGFHVEYVNAAVNTNKGVTYVLFGNEYVFELNECTLRGKFLGGITTVFPDIPTHITGAFRYTNGHLYFVTPKNVYEYSEFTKTVTNTVGNVFDVIKIDCLKDAIMKQLYSMISNLVRLKYH